MALPTLVKDALVQLGAAAIKAVAKLIARKADQDQWAQTPAAPRACPRCKEVAYTPGQVYCYKCGAQL